MQLVSGGMSVGAEGGGVAFFAHIRGFIAGMALIGLFKRRDVPFSRLAAHAGGMADDSVLAWAIHET